MSWHGNGLCVTSLWGDLSVYFTHKGPVTQGFDAFFDVSHNKLFKQAVELLVIWHTKVRCSGDITVISEGICTITTEIYMCPLFCFQHTKKS